MTKKETKLLAVLAVLSILFLLMVLMRERTERFVPPDFERAAQTGVPQIPDSAGYMPLEVEKGFGAGVNGKLTVEDAKTDIWLTSPEDNTVWIKLRIYAEDGRMLGETGILKPGEYVQSVKLSDIPKDTEDVTLKLMAYTPDTWYSAGAAELHTVLQIK